MKKYILICFCMITASISARQLIGKINPPDLTKDGMKTVNLKDGTYNLGATGLRGWIYNVSANNLDMRQGRTTDASRQILVTHVGKGTPADLGKVKVNDVIIGVNGTNFTSDARKSLAKAIQQAEKKGLLKLKIWRAGKTGQLQLRMKVLGGYAKTAPFNCAKSKRIFEQACNALAKEPINRAEHWAAVHGLALLASGKKEYMPKIKALAQRLGPKGLKLEVKAGKGMYTWRWGFMNIFLCEYYLQTGDRSVLPAIKEYSISLARGQSLFGTYGHGLAGKTKDGKYHGAIGGYGAVNQAGLTANNSLLLAKKCGIKHVELDKAIFRALKFTQYYVDKGSMPYGEHTPWILHGNNGAIAQSALMFALHPDMLKPAHYFAQMALASYNNREYGHTGQGFSYLWSAIGANAGGPKALVAFFKKVSWHFDLVRRSDGSFTYDGAEQHGPGKTHDNTYFGKSSYYGMSPNACYVLSYALALRKLYITGKGAKKTNWLSDEQISDAIAAGRFDQDRKNMNTDELISAFGGWSPIVRSWAAEELSKRKEAKSLIPKLIKLANDSNALVAQGAVETLGLLRAKAALPTLSKLVKHDDLWLRYRASEALIKLHNAAKPAKAELLKSLIETAQPSEPMNWDDPFQHAHGKLGTVIFKILYRQSIKDIEKKQLYEAIKALAQNLDGRARGSLAFVLNQLSAEDVKALGPVILKLIKEPAPANVMFKDAVRMAAFKVLTKHKFKEGIDVAVIYAKTQGGHGSESRTEKIMQALLPYGASAKTAIPGLKELRNQFNDDVKKGLFPKGPTLNGRRVGAVNSAIQSIKSSNKTVKLHSL